MNNYLIRCSMIIFLGVSCFNAASNTTKTYVKNPTTKAELAQLLPERKAVILLLFNKGQTPEKTQRFLDAYNVLIATAHNHPYRLGHFGFIAVEFSKEELRNQLDFLIPNSAAKELAEKTDLFGIGVMYDGAPAGFSTFETLTPAILERYIESVLPHEFLESLRQPPVVKEVVKKEPIIIQQPSQVYYTSLPYYGWGYSPWWYGHRWGYYNYPFLGGGYYRQRPGCY